MSHVFDQIRKQKAIPAPTLNSLLVACRPDAQVSQTASSVSALLTPFDHSYIVQYMKKRQKTSSHRQTLTAITSSGNHKTENLASKSGSEKKRNPQMENKVIHMYVG